MIVRTQQPPQVYAQRADIVDYSDQLMPKRLAARILSYYPQLEALRRFLEAEIQDYPPFPFRRCIEAAHVLTSIGLFPTAGYYTPRLTNGQQLKEWHALGYDEKAGLFIDISQDQFTKNAPEIAIMDRGGTTIFVADSGPMAEFASIKGPELENLVRKARLILS